MQVVISQPTYLPWLGYFDKIDKAGIFIIQDNVQFRKREWQNRNRIKTPDGWMWLTIPINKKECINKKINEITVCNNIDWKQNHWRAIEKSYSRAKYFKKFAPALKKIYDTDWARLIDINIALIEFFLKALEIKTKILRASDLETKQNKTLELIELCKKVKADSYLTGKVAKDFLDEDLFKKNKITLEYHNYNHPRYRQLFGSFIPYLSTLDLLFNHGEESLDIITGKKIISEGSNTKISQRIKRIMLIMPPRTIIKGKETKRVDPPLGLAYIAAVLLKHDYEVAILDGVVEGFENEEDIENRMIRFGLSLEKIAEKVQRFSPQVVGVSNLFACDNESAHDVCAVAKKINNDIITVIGGAHATALPEEMLKDSNLDFVVLGEGEYTFIELLKKINKGTSLTAINGLAYKKQGKIIIQPKTKFIENLDRLPFPARQLLPMNKYSEISSPHGNYVLRKPYASIITSRGCIANCIFCSVRLLWGAKYRPRSAENVLEEIELLVKNGFKEIHFEDDNLTVDKKRAERIFDGIIERKIDISWSTPSGVALYALDEKMLEKMKASGCYCLSLGIESGSQKVLSKIIKKPLNLKKVKPLVQKMKQLDIKTVGFFMFGLPGETKEQIKRTVEFAKQLNLDYSTFFIATPYPGTKLFEISQKKGYFSKEAEFKNFRYSKGNIKTSKFTPEFLEAMRKKAWLEVNFKK